MKLYGSTHSPFARKTRIVLHELDLAARTELVVLDGAPTDPPGDRAMNPLKKIPFLETDEGEILFDSRVVVEALLAAAEPETAARLLPPGGAARLTVLKRQALADGLCDAAVSVAYERRLRPRERHWPHWMAIQLGKVDAALAAIERELATAPETRFDLGDAAVAAAAPYLEFRFPERPWSAGHPALTAAYERWRRRPAVIAAA